MKMNAHVGRLPVVKFFDLLPRGQSPVRCKSRAIPKRVRVAKSGMRYIVATTYCNPSRRHQGKQECARRLKQTADNLLSKPPRKRQPLRNALRRLLQGGSK